MKLSEANRTLKQSGLSVQPYPSGQKREQLLRLMGIESSNFYQELEMDDPLVQTHQDTSYTQDVIALHSHTYYEMIFVRSGNLQYLVGTERYRIRRGDILLVAPGISHRPLFLDTLVEPYDRYVVWMSEEFAAQVKENWPRVRSMPDRAVMLRTAELTDNAVSVWENLFHRGVEEAQRRAAGWQAAVYANTLNILVELYRTIVKDAMPTPPLEKPELLDSIMAYVEDHLAEKITLETTARSFLVSESTISQLFRKRMGVSYYRFVTQRRLIAAKNLILSGVPMGEVAENVGFADYSSFYRAFKQEYGISPTHFRELQG